MIYVDDPALLPNCDMRMRILHDEHVDDVSLHTYIGTVISCMSD